jgi:hypothetical protein
MMVDLDSAPSRVGPRERLLFDVLLLALAVTATALILVDPPGAARPVVVFLAAISLPGAAILTRVPAPAPLPAIGLTIALSLAIDTLGSLILVWTGWFEPGVLGGVIGGVAFLAIAVDAWNQAHLIQETAPA